MKRIIVTSMMVGILSGCAVVKSTKLSPTAASSSGTVYYLPTRPVKIEFVRTAAATKQDIGKAEAAVKIASEALDTANKALKIAKKRRDATAVSTSARADMDKVVELSNADVKVAKDELDSAKTINSEDTFTDTITVTAMPSMADTRYRYSANLNHVVTRSDKLDLKTTPSGLLSTSTAKAEDQSAQILVSLAQSLAATGAVPGVPTSASLRMRGAAQPMVTPLLKTLPQQEYIECGNNFRRLLEDEPNSFRFEYVFDPTVENVMQTVVVNGESRSVQLPPWKYIQSSLCALGADYEFEWQTLGADVRSEEPANNDNLNVWPGLFYRRQLPYRLNIYSGKRDLDVSKNTIWKSLNHIKTVQLELPNASPPELLKITGTAFAARDFTTEFQEGLLVSHKENKPSEALSVVAIPYDIVKALISVPAEIISLKVDYSSNEAALVEAKTKLIQDLKAYQDVLNAKKGE